MPCIRKTNLNFRRILLPGSYDTVMSNVRSLQVNWQESIMNAIYHRECGMHGMEYWRTNGDKGLRKHVRSGAIFVWLVGWLAG
jgi:hypothetical protein